MIWPFCQSCGSWHHPNQTCEEVQSRRAWVSPTNQLQFDLGEDPLASLLRDSLDRPAIVGTCGHVLALRECFRAGDDHWCHTCRKWVTKRPSLRVVR